LYLICNESLKRNRGLTDCRQLSLSFLRREKLS